MHWTITPLCLGILELAKAMQISFVGFDERYDAPCTAWLLRAGEHAVLVDTGPSDVEWGKKYHRGMRKEECHEIGNALRANGVEPEDVSVVINTHLHWDHCWGNTEIPNAKIYIQREEMRYAAAPLPKDASTYETSLGFLLMARFYERIVPVDGDLDLLPGLRLLFTPGHSPGSQSVAVTTEGGIKIIAGDLVGLGEALKASPPLIPGIYHNLDDCYASFKKLLAISDDILPAHDCAVFERFKTKQSGRTP